ncbi:MAG: hypothetical protein A2Y41_13070 [Spirochaetes bacterium GWB1_36_13]|nr:MAG: hypothetical protein A2Y41_13070 [Spirochaetes bacterium GWB1_36_13]
MKYRNFIMIFLSVFLFLFVYAENNAKDEEVEKEVKDYQEILDFGIPDRRKDVLKSIEQKKDKRYYPLIQSVIENDLHPDVLEIAVRLAGDFEIKGLEEKILKIIEDKTNPKLEATALRTLGKLKYDKVSAKALEELDSESTEVKIAAIFTLGEIKEKKALDRLYEILDKIDEKEEILQEAIQSIGKIKDKKSIERLKDILENPGYSKYIRMYIPIALADIGGKEVSQILNKAAQDEEYVIRIRAIFAMTKLEGEDLNAVKKNIYSALKDSEMNVRITGLDVVKASKDREYIKIISYIMEKDPEVKVRKKAYEVFAELDSKENVTMYFKEKLVKGDFYAKQFIIQSMKKMDIEAILPMLEENFYNQDNLELRKAILVLLSERMKDGLTFNLIQKIASDKNNIKGFYDNVNKLRVMAMQILTREGWQMAFPSIRSLAEDFTDPLNIQALQMIPAIDYEKSKDYFINLMENMSDKPQAFRFQVVKTIFQLRPVGIEEALKKAFFKEKDMTIRTYLGRGMKSYGMDPEALEKQYQDLLKIK